MWRGCSKVSAGCAHCYAETLSRRNPAVLGEWGVNGTRVIASESAWKQPIAWDRAAARAGERRRVFCASMADVFEDRPELWAPRRRLARMIWDTPHLDWMLLTKRPENAEAMIYEMWFPDAAWPRNYWLGVSCEDQATAKERIPILLRTPAPVRFISAEPLLGPIDLDRIEVLCADRRRKITVGTYLDLVIVGGESGPGARPMHPAWARSLRDQCVRSKTAYFFKQWGGWAPVDDDTPRGARLIHVDLRGGVTPACSPYEPGCPCDHAPHDEPMVKVGKKRAGRLLDGREWDEMPAVAAPAAPQATLFGEGVSDAS